ncbi:unnamed protein product, partial [Mesorhabditis belari]|uniref:START domain-containing protein n=1 Tax=Mesorhabditis belari TaxID=2138241 RepID=A0AAF3J9P8_9BILA
MSTKFLITMVILANIFAMEQVLGMTSVTLHGVTDTLPSEKEKYKVALETAAAAFQDAEKLFADPTFESRDGWKVDQSNDDDDVVYAKHTKEGTKMVTVRTVLAGKVDDVMQETWTGASGLPEWNPNIDFASTIANLTDHVDILTYGNNDILVVSGREFVSARLYRKVGDYYIMASRSVNLTDVPEKRGKVRAWLYLAAARFRADPTDPENKTLTDVVMHVDLKGFLPKLLVNQVVGKIMLMDAEQNKKHFGEIKQKKDEAKKAANDAA